MTEQEHIDHQHCYMENKICNDDCAEVREQLDSKYAEMNKDKQEVNMDMQENDPLLNAKLKTIFEMLQIVIEHMELKDGVVGYDFSYAEVLFENPLRLTSRYDEYNKMVDANFKADYPK